jgi:hypothetical protein
MIERVRTRARLPERIAAMEGKSMSLVMPELNQKVLFRRDDIIRGLRRIVPGEGVISAATELRPYESDGFTAYRQPPAGRSVQRVSRVQCPSTKDQIRRLGKSSVAGAILFR